jgi:hypothetical protein
MSLPRKDREWVVMLADFAGDEASFRQAIVDELAGLENIGHRTGGAYVATPLRVPQAMDHGVAGLPPEEFVTIGWHFKQVAMTVGRAAPPAPEEELAPEPAPEAPEPVELVD